MIATKGGLTRQGPGAGARTAVPSTCEPRARRACIASVSTASTSTSSTPSTPRSRSRSHSARWSSCGRGKDPAHRHLQRRARQPRACAAVARSSPCRIGSASPTASRALVRAARSWASPSSPGRLSPRGARGQAALARLAARHEQRPRRSPRLAAAPVAGVVPIPGTSAAHARREPRRPESRSTPEDVDELAAAPLPGVPSRRAVRRLRVELVAQARDRPRRPMRVHAVEPAPRSRSRSHGRRRTIERLRPAWEAFQGDVVMTDPAHYQAVLGHDPRAYAPYVVLIERDGEPRALASACSRLRARLQGRIQDRLQAAGASPHGRLPGLSRPGRRERGRVLVDALLAALSTGEADVVYLPNLAMDSPFYTQPCEGQLASVAPPHTQDALATRAARLPRRVHRDEVHTLAGPHPQVPEAVSSRTSTDATASRSTTTRGTSSVLSPTSSASRERTYQRGLGVEFATTSSST